MPLTPIARKIYTALLGQTSTDNPIPIVLQNTLGNIAWTRHDVGEYWGTLTAAFTENKTIMPPFDNFMQVYLPIANTTTIDYTYSMGWIDANTIKLFICQPDWTPVELSAINTKLLIQVQVYN